jgi:predicted Zn-dependent peptidase
MLPPPAANPPLSPRAHLCNPLPIRTSHAAPRDSPNRSPSRPSTTNQKPHSRAVAPPPTPARTTTTSAAAQNLRRRGLPPTILSSAGGLRRATTASAAAAAPHRSQQGRRLTAGAALAGAAVPAPRASSSAAAAAPSASAPYRGGHFISATAYRRRRDGRLVICATLAPEAAATAPPQTAPAATSDTDPLNLVPPPLDPAAARALLASAVEPHPKLRTGRLPNGLEYVVLPNATPPRRFEAHLEVHVGSVDERRDEQGVAHLVEHVTFLGSRRREALLGTGARTNAYTDFHHTVFHVHAPLQNGATGQAMLPQVLDALAEIAFAPVFAPERVEKERKAVLAEAQMMNTVEYRIDCQLLATLHGENNLGWRFPIGQTEQVKTWPASALQRFWRRWYFPANATLFVIGDVEQTPDEVVSLIERAFGAVPAGRAEQDEVEDAHGDGTGSVLAIEGVTVPRGTAEASGAFGEGGPSSSAAVQQQQAPAGRNALSSTPPSAAAFAAASAAAAQGALEAALGSREAAAEALERSMAASSSSSADGDAASDPRPLKLRHPVRPPVLHLWGQGPPSGAPAPTASPAAGELVTRDAWEQGMPAPGTSDVSFFRHPLLQHFSLSLFCKLPLRPMATHGDLRRVFLWRVIMSVFQFRVGRRYMAGDGPFVAIDLDISDSAREGCAVSTLTVTSEPQDWRAATRVAIEEVRRLQRHGLTPGELSRYVNAMLRDSAQLAEQADAVSHVDTLDFVMESRATGSTVMEHRAADDAMRALAATITLEDANEVARTMLAFASDYGREGELLVEEAAMVGGGNGSNGNGSSAEPAATAAAHALAARERPPWADVPHTPTRCTSVLVSLPAYVSASGEVLTELAGAADRAAARASAASMGAAGHLDAEQLDLAELEAESAALDAVDVPAGAVAFAIGRDELAQAIAAPGLDPSPPEEVTVPDHLVAADTLDALEQRLRPRFVPPLRKAPLSAEEAARLQGTDPALPPPEAEFGVTLRRLSNGVALNYRVSDNEPKAGVIRIVAAGGRAVEDPQLPGPMGAGAVGVGVRALSECGAIGGWSREQIEIFCVTNLVSCALEADHEFLVLDLHFAKDTMERAFELAHAFLAAPVWDEAAVQRAKRVFASQAQSVDKSLERATSDRVMAAMLGSDARFRDPTPAQVEALTLDGVAAAVEMQLAPRNLEVNAVGDFDADELERLALRYLGTLPPEGPPRGAEAARSAVEARGGGRRSENEAGEAAVSSGGNGNGAGVSLLAPLPPWLSDQPLTYLRPQDPTARHMVWHMQDSDERAYATISGPAPCRWGPLARETPIAPLQAAVAPPPPPPRNSLPSSSGDALAAARRAHPLFNTSMLFLLTEVLNSRLFTTVRDALGLTYDVSFELSMFDRLRTGWFSATVTSYPDRIHDALAATLAVVRDLRASRVTPAELARAKRTLVTKHESELKTNGYWIALLTHLQAPGVPHKTVEALRDMVAVYESATVDDLYAVYDALELGDADVFTCVGTSGKVAPPAPPPPAIGGGGMVGAGGVGGAAGGDGKDPGALFAAMMTAAQAQGALLATALRRAGLAEGPPPPAGSEQQQQQQQQQQEAGRQ